MNLDQNSVKMDRPYHHGDLRTALVAAAEAVLTERGIEGFSLRETARRAGVSPSAPAHHFRDARGLLTALAVTAFRDLADALEAAAAAASGRDAKIIALGRAYVAFAIGSPARFDLMWRDALVDKSDPDFGPEAGRAFRALDDIVRPDAGCDRPGDQGTQPSIAAWSLVHGFARLAIDGAFYCETITSPEQAMEALLAGVLDHLQV